MFKKKNKK